MSDTGGDLLVAVDGGQTATKALVATIDGTILGAGLGGPSDHLHGPGGRERNRAAIQDSIRAAFVAACLPVGPVRAIALGLTGAKSAVIQLIESFVDELLPAGKVTITPDFITNLAGASAGRPGVVVIAGGGSIAYGRRDDGREAIVGGFGFLLGDEGSAFDIGRRAVSHACRASDGRDAPTALQARILREFHANEMREVSHQIYAADFSRERISLLAPHVAALAASGDATARMIMTTAGEQLGLLAATAIRQIGLDGASVPVYPTGGVFRAGELILAPFRSVLAPVCPHASIEQPRFLPVIGALILARQSLDLPISEAWLAQVAATLPAD